MLISDAFAAAGEAGAQGGSMAVTLTQLGVILIIFYSLKYPLLRK